MTEFLKIEIMVRGGPPQAQGIDGLTGIGDDRPIEWDADQGRGSPRDRLQAPTAQLQRASEVHFYRFVGAGDLPRILSAEPVVGKFALPAILDRLFENSVLVTESVAHRLQLHCCHGVDKNSSEAPETAVTEAGIGFLLQHARPVEASFLNRLLNERVEQQ